ncbi:hypothetical protein SDC9_86961 [bioreactor metagenome]|uniref:Uncharacterized protein n=1 Tax=bioreactor metagenome TaxID=1076179 RepID=A0A644ZKD4_9ZZZZ
MVRDDGAFRRSAAKRAPAVLRSAKAEPDGKKRQPDDAERSGKDIGEQLGEADARHGNQCGHSDLLITRNALFFRLFVRRGCFSASEFFASLVVFLDLRFLPLIGRAVVSPALQRGRHIVLLDPMTGKIVRVEIALAVAEPARPGKRGIPQIDRHRLVEARLRVRRRLAQRDNHAVGLWRLAEKDDCLRERESRFRQADMVERLRRGNGLHHRLRVGKSNVLAGVRNQPSRNDARIDPRVQQPRKPCNRRVGIPAAKALAERGEHVVKKLLVALDDLFLTGLGGDFARDVHHAHFVRRGGQHRELQRVERVSAVPVGDGGKGMQRFLVQFDAHPPEPAFFVLERVLHRLLNVLVGQRIKLKHAAAGDDGARHRDHRVFRRRSDEADRALFERGKQRVALGLAPAVALVEQQVGRLAIELEPLLRFLDNGAEFLDPRGDGVELDKRAAGRVGHNRGKRGLARTRWAKKDGGLQPVGQNCAAQQLALADNVLLADELVQRARAHAIRKRRVLFYIALK